MRTKKLEVYATGGGECKFYASGTPIDIIALWAALTDYVVHITGNPLCELVKAADSYDKEKWPERLEELAKAEKDGRLVALPSDKARLVQAILAERERQDKLWGSPQENTYAEWAAILGEEYGEAARELNELNFGRGDRDKMFKEAVQVAAVALAILEQDDVARMVTLRVALRLGRMKGGDEA